MKNLTPWVYVNSLIDVSDEYLKAHGVKYAFFDYDGTLWDRRGFMDPVNSRVLVHYVQSGLLSGFVILSNAVGEHKVRKEERIRRNLEGLGLTPDAVLCLGKEVRKPLPGGFALACQYAPVGLKPSQIIVVGDQLVADIAGGNACGHRTILVNSVGPAGFMTTISLRAWRNKRIMNKLQLTTTKAYE